MKKLVLKKAGESHGRTKQYKINYEQELNLGQYEAVMHNKGPALVIAGAGTGKTRTLVYRVARMIEDGIPPESILLLTFTRKSASEMLRRAAQLLDGRCEDVAGGTFHSFAVQVLRQYSKLIGFDNSFSILDQSDSEDAINLLRTEFVEKGEKRRFPSKQTIQRIYSMAVNTRSEYMEIIEKEYPFYIEESDRIIGLIEYFNEYKKKHNLMDYDDLLVNLLNLLRNHPKILGNINSKYTYLMVDEYQDTNKLQHEIVLLLSGKNSNIMAVGDDAQSIYSFRGASYQNIMFFPESFSNCKIFKIEENFRSTEQILNLSNHLINDAIFKYEKKLFSIDKKGENPYIIATVSEREQSQFIVQQVLELRESGIPLNNAAVLFRSGFHSFDLEIELEKANIPFVKFGGMKFVEAAHIKDMVAFLRILSNPVDAISWQRILLLIPGIGPKKASRIISYLNDGTIKLTKPNDLSQLGLDDTTADLINIVLKLYGSKESISDKSALFSEFYRPLLQKKHDDWKKRWDDILTFITISERYTNLQSFLNDLALDPPSETLSEMEAETGDSEILTLSTIHSAKGLEWDAVFIIWALEGRFPSSKAVKTIDSIEEERRLFYVACTRARDYLYISYPTNIFDRESGFVLSEPSRFIKDIPDNIADKYVLTHQEDDNNDFNLN